LVNASSSEEPSVISGVTYRVEIVTHSPDAETPVVQDVEDKSAVKKSYGQQRHCLTRRRIWVIALAILVVASLGLAVGLGVTHFRSTNTNDSGKRVGDQAHSTTPPPPLTTTVPPVTTSSLTLRPTEAPTEPPTMEPTSPPQESSMSVEGAEMVLGGISSRLDQDAIDAWIDVTWDFIVVRTSQVLDEKAGGRWYVNAYVAFTSQTEDDDELTIIFSVEFDIESSLETHNVRVYVRDALDNKDAYIQKLQDFDSSFQDVYNVKVSV
jgi:hypothetical protein